MTTFFVHYLTDHIICGLPGVVCSDNRADVTCPLCLYALAYEMEMSA